MTARPRLTASKVSWALRRAGFTASRRITWNKAACCWTPVRFETGYQCTATNDGVIVIWNGDGAVEHLDRISAALLRDGRFMVETNGRVAGFESVIVTAAPAEVGLGEVPNGAP